MSEEVQQETRSNTGPELFVSEDRMLVTLSGRVSPEKKASFIRATRAKLIETHIADNLIEDAINNIIKAILPDQETVFNNIPILRGSPPVPPKDAVIEWARDFFKEGYYIDPETGAADYRRLAADLEVATGDFLARITPPVEGKAGCDVLGNEVPPRPPRTITIQPGNNVSHNAADDSYYAIGTGRIRYAAGTLSIDDVFTITGSVGLESGHIHHRGTIIINENIEALSQVEATGDIEVSGYIEDAIIKSGGNLTVRGGISGGSAGGCQIYTDGNVQARFIQNATIHCQGDVVVEREIAQSTIKTRGRVIIPNGRIVGGDIMALAGIDVGRIGTEACVPTQLIAGEDYSILNKISQRQKEITPLRDKLKKINATIDPLMKNFDNLPDETKKNIDLLLQKARLMEEQIKQLQREIDDLWKDTQARASKEVIIRNMIFPDTQFMLDDHHMTTQEEIKGPVKVRLHEGSIKLFAHSGN